MKLLKEFIIGKNQLPEVVDFLMNLKKRYPIITFTGPLGAGKTTLVQLFLKRCGVQETITSPTFTIMNSYHNNKGETFYHFDLYRLTNLDDFFQGGFEEYLYQPNSVVCIEWPEIIMPFLNTISEKVCSVVLDYSDIDKRIIKIITQ
ncbi:MAG: tRNA (adenosine(37)-N6)-threonylcarbamoyltransferase complex ATPase subunit type 1 TsaE [Candidatus Dependentiae bacterium]